MTKVKTANVQQCLKAIGDYVNADTNAKDLGDKKAIAKKALEHLGTFFSGKAKDIAMSGCGRAVLSIASEITSNC
jgi:hypothetical protein